MTRHLLILTPFLPISLAVNVVVPCLNSNGKPSISIASLIKKYPRAAGSLFTTYNDLLLVQTWADLVVIDLPSCSRGAFRGRRPNTDTGDYVVPCSMTESLSLDWVKGAFKELDDPPSIYIAVTTEDSSLVYYKISHGFVKPPL